jgi:anthranilate synthase component I
VEGGQKITIRPLAGTRPRASSPEADKAAEQELINDPKERAEHVMLIDLARNDIGRIAKTGPVKVTEAFAVERYSHVMHIVSNVEGDLLDGMTGMDVLKATFPAGTLSGAPKVHAMEVIDQLEPTKRGLYGGACGYLSYSGDMDVAITIRTGIIKDQVLYVQAAAGVVYPSWNGEKPKPRRGRCCGLPNLSKKGWSKYHELKNQTPHDRQLRQFYLQHRPVFWRAWG